MLKKRKRKNAINDSYLKPVLSYLLVYSCWLLANSYWLTANSLC